MTRKTAAPCLAAALLLAATTIPMIAAAQSRASDRGTGRLLDGAAGGAVFKELRELGTSDAGEAKPPRIAAASAGGDLFYFSAEEAAEGLRLHGMQEESFAPGYTFDPDVPPAIQNQMRDDLAFIRGIQGNAASALHSQIFGEVDGSAYARFFESRVKAIGVNGCGNSNAVACVIPMMGSSKMWLTQNYIKFSHPQVARMMVVFHEARHTEVRRGNWPHAHCPTPFRDANGNDMKSIWTGASLAGQPACDTTPFGSYGSSTIMLKNIQKSCANCTDKVRMDAGIYADDQLNRVTDPGAKKQILDDLYK